ncbi:MAG: UPF0280 family protein [Alphaproteobacteria bacterium]|jgi:hypothetical protein|nr:UPF0280 family protein [Alphaproteobacteria bacterium]
MILAAVEGPRSRLLPDGRRRHLSDGPIDLVIEAFGDADAVADAYGRAERRFRTVLTELVTELPRLRRPLAESDAPFKGAVALRMARAVARFPGEFVTPMAAVAGAVADEILQVMRAEADLAKAYVNNGGDIALHLSQGQEMRLGLLPEALSPDPELGARGLVRLRADRGVGGVATSGAGGRSFSLGIADAVTVLAADAAMADAAATLIANAVDVASPLIRRRPAESLDPDSDLGQRLVTVEVPRLPESLVETALEDGLRLARRMRRGGQIVAAALSLQGRHRICGDQSLGARQKPAIPA